MPAEKKNLSPNTGALADFIQSMESPLQSVRMSAWDFDPWSVAGLEKDEVRNTRVLAWLMNPMGSHGYGDALLRQLLEHLKTNGHLSPYSLDGYCRVRTEVNPNGDKGERVDIEVDAASFYLLIEVKIGAFEGVDQLNRYGSTAESVAGRRPWAMVYLTPGGGGAKTGSNYADRILPLSWKEMAGMIDRVAMSTPMSSASSWHAANHAARAFAKHIRNH